MKTLYVVTLLLLTGSMSFAQEKKLPPNVSNEWFNNVAASINQSAYDFHYIQNKNAFSAINNANRLSFVIDETGYTAEPLQTGDNNKNWQVHFGISVKASGVTKGDNGDLTWHTPNMDIQYVHTEKGLRQNFIIKEKDLNSTRLTVRMQVTTDLNTAVINGNKLAFYTAKDLTKVALTYEDLQVWDANRQVLPARMKLDKNSKELSIEVDDRNATYPVTIDPLNKTPEWTSDAVGVLPGLLTNLQVQALYGYTVAGLGDINNDGYDDVAVSAPAMADVITGTGTLAGVGAVYIYLGSASGLSNTAAKVLQPTTPVAGALFGFSVDAGDVTGDNIPDIIISAPGDSYQTQASGLLGPVSVTVTAGKVYLYRSEDLFTAPNPSAFLQLRLQGTGFFNSGVLGLLDNTAVKALFGYSVAVTDDLNGDGKKDIIIGCPAYVGTALLSVQNGAAFVYYSNDLSTTAPVQLAVPTPSILGLISLPLANLNGLLFGFSVDGIGDYNNDGRKDVIVGAPAGIDVSSLGGIFSGQVLGGSAYVYYGTGSGINPAIGASLRASSSTLLANVANLFGYKVKGVRNAAGARNGNILVSAPAGNLLGNLGDALQIKAGQLHVFTKQTGAFTSPVSSTQVIASPRSTSILSVLAGRTITASLLFGAGLDNIRDVNCDTYGDIIVGEPLSTSISVVGTDVVGGAAYIYTGKADGTYVATPSWTLSTQVSALLGVNTTALVGYSVAGAGYTKGTSDKIRVLVGGPSNTLDFGSGLLNLSSTLNTLTSFVFDNNGLGKTYTFNGDLCNLTTLPTTLTQFSGYGIEQNVKLDWKSVYERDLNYYEVQRSNNGGAFESIAMVFAKDEDKNEYSFIDKNPSQGINLYRLRMTDDDAKFSYSQVISIRFDTRNMTSIVVSPNPVRNEFRVQLKGMQQGMYTLKLYNVAGQVVYTMPAAVTQELQTINIGSAASIKNGVYWLSLFDRTGSQAGTVKVVIGKN